MKATPLFLFTVLALPAQDHTAPDRRYHPGPPPRMQKFQERIQAWRTERIIQTMNLPEDKARLLSERWTTFDREFMERGGQIVHLRERFNEILLGPGSDEEKSQKLKPMVEQYLTLRRQQMELKSKFEEGVRSQLTPAQQARFILLVEDLQRHLRESLAETMKDHRPRRRNP